MDTEKEKYEVLRSYLRGNEIAHPSQSELEDIFSLVLKQEEWSQNVGHRVERIKNSPREKAFHDMWLKWNEPRTGINNGNGILQDLFIDKELDGFTSKWIAEISPRERWIVATIIQWLGTNVGMSFLSEALRQVNMHIVDIKK